ncbi:MULTISPECIES: hypothetical protein [Citrobacter]|nr:hypothetical protein [Citrobacter sp. W9]
MKKEYVRDYAIQYASKAFGLTFTQYALLVSLLHYRCMSYNNVCNPARERLSMSTGIKKIDDITAHGKILEDKGILTRVIYTEAGRRNKRIQYNFNDEFILENCKRVEAEWYAQFKEDERETEQAEVIANPDSHTEEEVKKAITPEPKPIPEGKTVNPITGRLEAAPKQVARVDNHCATDLLSMLKDERSLSQIKNDAENARWNKQREYDL